MFRARSRTEGLSGPTSARGSVGSARVWDAATRERRTRLERDGTVPAAPVAGDELAALVAGIVHVTLDTRLPECQGARRSELARELQARLLAIFGGATRPPTPDAPADGTTVQPRAPEAAATPAASPPDALRDAPPAIRALALVLEERLSQLGGPLAERVDLRARLIRLAAARLDGQEEAPAASEEELRSLDLLQRRAAKLERCLQETRAALAYVSGLERVDPGLASIYRAIQGLADDDPRREQKASVLELVFRANLALQKAED